jgi:hypothetical protein
MMHRASRYALLVNIEKAFNEKSLEPARRKMSGRNRQILTDLHRHEADLERTKRRLAASYARSPSISYWRT